MGVGRGWGLMGICLEGGQGGLLWGDPKGWGHGHPMGQGHKRRAHVWRCLCACVCPPRHPVTAGRGCPPLSCPGDPPPRPPSFLSPSCSFLVLCCDFY